MEKYGVETTATVYQINSNIYSSYALLHFEVENKLYQTSIKLQIGSNFKKRIYYGKKHIEAKIGQKFNIMYSGKNPNTNKVISQYPIQ